jgi:hypothetical protein
LRLSTDPSPSAAHYSIRAVQGHSLKSIEATSLLTPITLENAPEICVHGTFFGTWPTILTTGGLKAMTRNHIHFANGPAVDDVLPREGANGSGGIHLKTAMAKSEVVSGMRGDAEVLIYIDVKRSIADGKMQWYRSENGVILTEGVLPPGEEPPTKLEETALMLEDTPAVEKTSPPPPQKKNRGSRANSAAYRQQPQPRPQPKTLKMVSTEYWEMVIGIGVGVLWQRGKGVVKDVPAELLRGGEKGSKKAVKGHVRNKGKGSENPKPKMMVEWDDIDGYH